MAVDNIYMITNIIKLMYIDSKYWLIIFELAYSELFVCKIECNLFRV